MPLRTCTHPWEFAVTPFRIAGSLYYVGNKFVSSHLIDAGETLILIDTGFPQTTYLLLDSIRRLGFDPAKVGHIFHCHGHYDHFGGTRAIVELTGATTYLGADDVEILESRPELSGAPQCGMEFYEVFEVNVPLRGGEVITVGNTAIECVSIPGHTAGSIAYFFSIEERGRSHTVGIHGGTGLNTLTGEYLAAHNLPETRRADYLASLQKLRQRSPDITLGAHPFTNDTFGKRDAMTDQKNPFIDPHAWPALIKRLEKSFNTQLSPM